MKQKAEILNREEMARVLQRIAHEIIEKHQGMDNLVIIGIKTRGAYLAPRLAQNIQSVVGKAIPVGALDITLYRDDFTEISERPLVKSTDIPFDVHGKKVILVDDVIYTGRTTRAALDALLDVGRPLCVQLAALIDRGHRQLPIQADFVGRFVTTAKRERIYVYLEESDGMENVVIVE